MKRLIPGIVVALADQDAERARRNHDERIAQLQKLPAASLAVVADITLADAVITPIPHTLGRKPAWVAPSCVRGAVTTGRIEEIRSSTYDRGQVVALKATGWGGPITIDLVVL